MKIFVWQGNHYKNLNCLKKGNFPEQFSLILGGFLSSGTFFIKRFIFIYVYVRMSLHMYTCVGTHVTPQSVRSLWS